MKRTMKKILALVLTVVMCLSVAMPAFATDATETPATCLKEHTKAACDAEKLTYTKISTYEPKCGEQGYTLYQCSCGKYFADDIVVNLEEHNWETTKEETCLAVGEKKCTKCDKVEEIDTFKAADGKTGRDEDGVVHSWKATTEIECGKPGALITFKCDRCDATKTEPASDNHTWVIEVITAPSCDNDGKAKYTCSVCNYVKDVVIDADSSAEGHDWEDKEAVEPTCTTGGNTAGKVCKKCGEKVGYETLAPTHSFGEEPTHTTEPSCFAPSYNFYACTKCTGEGSTKIEINKEINDGKPLGHSWTREGSEETPKSVDVTECTDDEAGKTVTVWECSICETEQTVTTNHVLEKKEFKATCNKGAYTYYACKNGCEGEFNATEPGAPDLSKHVWVTDVNNAPTCTTPGDGYAVCSVCAAVEVNHVIDPLGHIWEREDSTYVPVLDCANGKLIYTCTCGHTESKDIEGFNKDNPAHHVAGKNDTWVINKLNEPADACTSTVYYQYSGCDCGYNIIVPVVNDHKKDINNKYNAPKCIADGNLENYHCEVCGKWFYVDAEGVTKEIKAVEGEDILVTVAKTVTLKAHGCDITVVVEYVAPTCTTTGVKAAWKCAYGADCDVVFAPGEADALATQTDVTKLKGTRTSKGNADIIGKVTHAWSETDYNMEDDGLISVQNVTCEEYGYELYECEHCAAWMWKEYQNALGHDIKTVNPTCTEGGYKYCANGAACQTYYDEDATTAHKAVVETLAPTGHKDKDGNVIKCIFEDAACYVCSPKAIDPETGLPYVDEDGEPTGELVKTIEWETTHNWDIAEIKGSCVNYEYYIVVCKDCLYHEARTNDDDKFFELGEHDDGQWVVKTPATWEAAGVEELLCTRCDEVLDTRPIKKTGVELYFDFDNALVPGASIVNSGYLAVTVTIGSFEQDLHSLHFGFGYDEDLLKLVEWKSLNENFDGHIFAATEKGVVNVYASVNNTADGKVQNVNLTGETELVTLIFKVADNAHLEGKYATPVTCQFTASYVEVLKADATSVSAKLVGYDIPTSDNVGNAGDETDGSFDVIAPLGGYGEDIVETVLGATDEATVINIGVLGDVTGEADRTYGKVATAADVDAIQGMLAGTDYNAAADVDKDGEITVADFEYLAKYIVGAIDYAKLCALGAN